MTPTTHARVAALLAAGLLAAGTCGAAQADVTTSGNGSIGGGNQINADIDAPINVCGNAIAVLGIAGAACTDGDAEVNEPVQPEKPGKPEVPDYPDYPEEPETPETPEEPEVPEEPETPEEPEVPEEPETPEEPEVPETPEKPETPADEKPTPEPSEEASPPLPDESSLAVTGADQSTLIGLVAAAAGAVAAGVGMLLFGRRRKAGA